MLGDLDKAREALSSLADHPFSASVARDARKAHAAEPAAQPHGEPAVDQDSRRLAAAQHLAALGLAPEQCSTPNAKTAHRNDRREGRHEVETTTDGGYSREIAGRGACTTTRVVAGVLPSLWKFEVIGRKVDLGAKHGGAALSSWTTTSRRTRTSSSTRATAGGRTPGPAAGRGAI